MLQQTQVAQAVPYFNRFIDRFPDVSSLATADVQSVLKAWEGLGYYARGRNLHRAAKQVVEALNGEIPKDIPGLKALPGVGDYIAAAVASIAFDVPVAAVDGNVKRVLSRLLLLEAQVNDAGAHGLFRLQAERLLDRRQPGLFNQAMMELGALVCTPLRPRCGQCPVASACLAKRSGREGEYPKRAARRKVPIEHIAVAVVEKRQRVLITRRKPDGLLGGLWEFPGGKVKTEETAHAACVREVEEEVGLQVEVLDQIARIRHAYTHFKIIMDVFRCRYKNGRVRLNGPTAFKWVTLEELKEYPFPKANHKFIPMLFDGRT